MLFSNVGLYSGAMAMKHTTEYLESVFEVVLLDERA